MAISRTRFEGYEAVAFETAAARLIVVTEVGPRIAFFGAARGRNLLFWDSTGAGRGDWRLYGGHRIWTTRPWADESEEAYAADNAPCRVRLGKNQIVVEAPAVGGIKKVLRIRALATGHFEVRAKISNVSDMLWSGGVWAITCTGANRRTTYRVPVGEDTTWDVVHMAIARRWAGHRSRLNDPQFTMTETALVVRPDGHEAKRFVRSPHGVVAMSDGRLSFIKHAPFIRTGTYPHSANIALYLAPTGNMVEMETMSPAQTLAPGESYTHQEDWFLRGPIDPRATPRAWCLD